MPSAGSVHDSHDTQHRDGSVRKQVAWLAGGLALALAFSTGCRRDEVTHFRVPKESPALAMPAAMPGFTGGPSAGDVPPPASTAGAGALRWTLPKGWSEAQGGAQMRHATLKPPVPGKLDVSVIVLPGPAGGELANVNRWRNQIGLPPLEEAGLAQARKKVRSKAGEVSVYDFASEGPAATRTVAGLTSVEGNTWFIKMTGDADAVGAARPAFLDLLGSLRREDAR